MGDSGNKQSPRRLSLPSLARSSSFLATVVSPLRRGSISSKPPESLPPLLGGEVSCPLLGSRQFVADLAKVAEQLVMDDMTENYWLGLDGMDDETALTAGVDALRMRASCRERAAFFAPDKFGDVKCKPASKALECHLRRQRANWAVGIHQRYRAKVLEWIDTGEGLEKQAAVLLMRNGCPGGRPVLVVAWRGSKSLRDYGITDTSPFFVPLPWPAADGGGTGSGRIQPEQGSGSGIGGSGGPESPQAQPAEGGGGGGGSGSPDTPRSRARFMPLMSMCPKPCVSLGLWTAYAGSRERSAAGLGPRSRVRAAVERALKEEPRCRVCITGHSLGGSLATLCALDLLAASRQLEDEGGGASGCGDALQPLARDGVTLVSFASPRLFNLAFQQAATDEARRGRLHPLRVLVRGDIINRLPPRRLGGAHGVTPRLLLHPQRVARRASTASADSASAGATAPAGMRAIVVSVPWQAEGEFAGTAGAAAAAERLPEPSPPTSSSLVEDEPPPAMSFRDDARDDYDADQPAPPLDLHAHTSHALFLSGEGTPRRPQTISRAERWPLQVARHQEEK